MTENQLCLVLPLKIFIDIDMTLLIRWQIQGEALAEEETTNFSCL